MRGVVEVANYTRMGCVPLPAQPWDGALAPRYVLEQPYRSLYPVDVSFADYHEFLFRMKRFKLGPFAIYRSVDGAVKFWGGEFYRHPEIAAAVDERTLMLWPGCVADSRKLELDWFPGLSNLIRLMVGYPDYTLKDYDIGGFMYGQTLRSLGLPDQVGKPHWPPYTAPEWNPGMSTALTDERQLSPPPGAYVSVDQQTVWPLVYFEMNTYAGRLTNVNWPMNELAHSLGYVLEKQAQLDLLGWGNVDLLGANFGNTSIDPELRLRCVEWYERRDANGRNPVWDRDTGAQIIPIPTDTDR